MKDVFFATNTLSASVLLVLLHLVVSWKEAAEDACAEILNGEHLEDVLCNKENKVARNALLILYGPECQPAAEDLWVGLLDVHLPSVQHLTILRHDHVSAPNNSWFNYSDKYNLTRRLHALTCLQVNYFRGELQLDEALRYPSDDYTHLAAWIWRQHLITVTIKNNHKQGIIINVEGYTPDVKEQSPMMIKPNENVTFDTYTSNIVTVHTGHDEEFFNAFQLTQSTNISVTDQSKYRGKEEVWRIKIHLEHMEYEGNSQLFLCSHHRRHFNILTQPRALPNFTESGYLLTRIPEHVHGMLVQIFEDNKKRLSLEYYPRHFSVWNLDEIDIKQVTLSEGKTLYLAEELQPILETWCKCSLHPTKGEGIVTRIRMYPKGSRVRMHVDEVESGHVIGAILQVTQDTNTKSWPLEVIGFDGLRQEIVMNPGDMLLFESSRLVHGRPETLQGEFYVNSFFYFTPKEGWDVFPTRGSGRRRETDGKYVDAASTTPEYIQVKKSGQRAMGHADEL